MNVKGIVVKMTHKGYIFGKALAAIRLRSI